MNLAHTHQSRLVVLAISTALLVSLIIQQAVAVQPNVILILADDMAVGDFASVNGGISRTPNLDRLAQQSVVFDEAYSASCVCAPARAAMFTGRYPHRTGVVTLNMNKYPELTRLRSDETTIAEVFKSNGYTTGLVGKWHCGAGKDFSPLRHGFDEFEGFSGSQDLSYFKYTLQINDQKRDMTDQYLTTDLSSRAIEFVRRYRDQHFFLHLAHYAPHRPIEAPAELVHSFRAKGLNESTATIYAMIEVMDRGIGRLMDVLDELKLTDNTVVIFASDNGPDPLTGERFNTNLKGMKYEVYEGGIRVPLMIRWPGNYQPKNVTQTVHFVDLFPTLCELCQLNTPTPLAIDGVSLSPLLAGESSPARPRFWQWNRGNPNYTHNAAMRDGPWKLVRRFITRNANPKDSDRPPLLFNLSDDPHETVDVSGKYPKRTVEMNQRISQWSRSVEADRVRKPAPSLKSKCILPPTSKQF